MGACRETGAVPLQRANDAPATEDLRLEGSRDVPSPIHDFVEDVAPGPHPVRS